jgi:large subunit ribosomal protein L11
MVDLGKMLGPTGVNMALVKKEYDAATADQRGDVVPVVVEVLEDRGFQLVYKTPPAAFLIRRELGIDAASAMPGRVSAGTLSQAALRRVAERKLPDLNTADVEKAMRIVAGTARSMGVAVGE